LFVFVFYTQPLTYEITTYLKPTNRGLRGEPYTNLSEMNLLNESFKFCVEQIRKSQYLTLDLINFELIDLLHDLKGVTYFEDLTKDKIVFALPLTKLKTK